VFYEDYMNPTAYGIISWWNINSFEADSDTSLENYKQRLHELPTRRCTRIDHAVRWVGTKIREPPSFHRINGLEKLLA